MQPKIPLNLRINKKSQKDIAYAQDILVEQLYNFFPNAVIHGGTAIWRCYNGNRFSEDVDVYISKDNESIKRFLSSLENKGFKIIKKRIKGNSIYSEFIFNGAILRFEATFQTKKSIFKRYETSESSFNNVFTLTSEDLAVEKIDTYLKRRKIRDLYDIYFLLHYIGNFSKIKNHLEKLIKNFESPVDEKNLATIIISGSVPSYKQLLLEIKKWAK